MEKDKVHYSVSIPGWGVGREREMVPDCLAMQAHPGMWKNAKNLQPSKVLPLPRNLLLEQEKIHLLLLMILVIFSHVQLEWLSP